MLPRSAKQKGKVLENFVADELSKIDKYAYRRADSGSGFRRKEDVFTTLPFFIECKNQAKLNITLWWKKTCFNCPEDKYPILIYKQNYQHNPVVYMWLDDLFSFISDKKINAFEENVMLFFTDFMSLLRRKYENSQTPTAKS
jgi:hypothetical protein